MTKPVRLKPLSHSPCLEDYGNPNGSHRVVSFIHLETDELTLEIQFPSAALQDALRKRHRDWPFSKCGKSG